MNRTLRNSSSVPATGMVNLSTSCDVLEFHEFGNPDPILVEGLHYISLEKRCPYCHTKVFPNERNCIACGAPV